MASKGKKKKKGKGTGGRSVKREIGPFSSQFIDLQGHTTRALPEGGKEKKEKKKRRGGG